MRFTDSAGCKYYVKMKFKIKKTTDKDKEWLLEIVRGWGADFIVSRGRKIYPTEIESYYAEDDSGKKLGLISFEITGDQCEIVTLDAFEKFKGVGTVLLKEVVDEVRQRGCKRIWLVTLNDNLDAIRFYQKRGFTIAAVHVNALKRSREIKPQIATIGQYGIPLRDELEFEMLLD